MRLLVGWLTYALQVVQRRHCDNILITLLTLLVEGVIYVVSLKGI
jgi:hypothetical protein